MNTIAVNIIRNCNLTSVVKFAVNQTDWSYYIGLLPSGKVDFF
jgi:hypothetical protein